MNGETTVAELRQALVFMKKENTGSVILKVGVDGRLVEFELRLISEVGATKQ